MVGRVIDMNNTAVFVSFENGLTIDVNKFTLPSNVKIGDTVRIDTEAPKMTNDKLVDFF
ncbi:hypothetical protein GCM10008905_27550 [Clostridium malenominatum]|uniref:S1 motif domain-containing protein n=1 Tax=Clostridium malenominatum TaxID=1539 RepID=A0ABP3UFJ9_9CLOT